VPGLVADLDRTGQEQAVSSVQAFQEIGGLVGRFVLARLVVRILSRRNLLRVFQIPGLIVMPLVFLYAAMYDLTLLKYGAFLIGLLTVAQFSFWGNYLPGVYPVHLRGTGEGFAANIGGRMIGTSAAWVTTTLATGMPLGTTAPEKLAFAAGFVGLATYVIGFIASFWLPEPRHEEMPKD
jgi:hypothetical protein